MQPRLTSLLIVALAVQAGCTARGTGTTGLTEDPPKPKTSPTAYDLEALKAEYEEALKKFGEENKAIALAAQQAKSDEEKKAAEKKLRLKLEDNPSQKYATLFLEYAAKNPKDASAFEALQMALRTCGGSTAKNGVWSKAVHHLQADYVTRPEILKVVRMLATANDEAGHQLIREVIARNPDRKIQARAVKALGEGCQNVARMAELVKGNAQMRKTFESQAGNDYVEKFLAYGGRAKQEGAELTRTFREKYADVFPDLSIGKPAPEVVSQDLDGHEVKLSALRGKVVVLNIWVTRNPHCRAMIPHQRTLVGRLKDKPFVLVSIGADEKKRTLTDFLAKENLPWTHWWNGADGGIVEDWEVKYFPAIYVLDAKGVIRYKDVKDDKLEEAVHALLKEAAEKK